MVGGRERFQERRMAARNRPPGSGEVAGEGAGRRGGQVAEDLGGKGTGRRRMADRNQVTEILLGGKGQVVGE